MSAMTDPETVPGDERSRGPLPSPLSVTLAFSSIAAAAIHFAVVGDHFDVGLLHGLFFVTVAWAQVLWALAVLVAPRPAVLTAGIVGSAAIVAVWALSRTVGVPVPPDPWSPEAVGVADLVATGLELVVIAGGVVALSRPRTVAASTVAAGSVTVAIGLALALIGSAAIANIGEHGHAHAAEPAGGAEHEHAAGHATGESGSGAHSDGHVTVAPGEIDPAQIDLVRRAMRPYQDVDMAFEDGWETEHEDWPEVGSHFYRGSDWTGPFPAKPGVDLLDPEFLMYSKLLSGDEWELIAVAYVADKAVYPEPPAELSGAEWHEHKWTCMVDGEELEEDDVGPVSRAECDEMSGTWSPGGVWMTHVWFIDNPAGVTAESNPALV
jgi:hypothetical protein